MNRSSTVVLIVVAAGALLLAGRQCRRAASAPADLAVTRGPLAVWTSVEGYLESRQVVAIMSQLGGPATVVELAPDGTAVNGGAPLVRFDAAQLERDVLKLERDHAIAREEMSSLVNARLPLELREIEQRLTDAQERLADEQEALNDDRDLARDGLLSDKDLKSQEARVASAGQTVRAVEQQVELTRKYVQPSLVERAKATLSSAEQELDLARRQLSNCVIRAPGVGVVGYKPLALGGEFRTVRVGDTVFRNQPFMTVSDMTNLVLYADVPEAELTRFSPGAAARVIPVAFPGLEIEARVEAIGSTARTASGRAGNQRFFGVTIRLDRSDPRLRSGMTAQARVLSYSREDAILIPRIAVTWEGGTPWCRLRQFAGDKRIPLKLGMADETHFEVLAGIEPGTQLVTK